MQADALLITQGDKMDITDIYFNIGRILRESGADGIYIIKSNNIYDEKGMHLAVEVVVDRIGNFSRAYSRVKESFPDMDFLLFNGEDADQYEILQEAREDGIKV